MARAFATIHPRTRRESLELIACLFLTLISTTFVCGDEPRPRRSLVVFSAMGDVPYTPEEYLTLKQQLAELPKESEFVVHLGDIKAGKDPCDEQIYRDVASILTKSPCPLFMFPGDNEWNDCAMPDDGWAFWTKHFKRFDEKWKHDLVIKRQDKRDENFAFVRKEVLFVGINIVGGRVHDAAEWKQRHAENLEWTRWNIELYRDSVRSAIIFGHAFPLRVHDDYFKGLNKVAADFRKPVLYLHGDGHRWIRNRPFDAQNILRIQVDQGGIAPPIKITVTDDPVDPFVVDRRKEID